MVDINTLFDMLDWDSPKEVQEKGIEEARNIRPEYLSVLFRPSAGKSTWENCAKAICLRTDEELQGYLYDMFQWLQDMSWPGAQLIYDRLARMNAKDICATYCTVIREARKSGDREWLRHISGFIENKELCSLLPVSYQQLMEDYLAACWGGRDEENAKGDTEGELLFGFLEQDPICCRISSVMGCSCGDGL